jgi:shikimate kinase
MAKNIVLIGLMGSGKTTIGKALADRTGREFADTDELIVEKDSRPIKQIFAENGEEFFRNLETKVIEEVSKQENFVISTGGGAVLRDENIDFLKENGVLFYLYAPAEVIWERVKDDKDRPLLNVDAPIELLKRLQQEREPFYGKADFKINTHEHSIEEIVDKIIELFDS